MAGASSSAGTAKVDGGVITFSRVRGGGCFGAAANRIELGTFSLPECADKVRLDAKCSPHFEWDTGNTGGVAGHGWCGCGAAGGNGCAGANEPGSSSAIYNVVFTPDSQWGVFFLLFGAIAVALYVGAGVALGRRQGRDAHSGGGISDALAVHPHYSHWRAVSGLVHDGAVFTKAKLEERTSAAGGYQAVPETAAAGPAVDGDSSDDELVE